MYAKELNRNVWFIANKLGNLQFAIFLLLLIASFSSIGTFIEQGKDISFYELNYPNLKPLFGFINAKFILFFWFRSYLHNLVVHTEHILICYESIFVYIS